MGEEFNYREYGEALSEFIIKAESLPPVIDHPGFRTACMRICGILRISKIDMYRYESHGPKDASGIQYMEFYSVGNFDMTRSITITKKISNGDSAEYIIYPFLGARDWSIIEREKITAFITSLYVVNARTSLLNVAEKLSFYDKDMNIPNMAYFFRSMSIFIAKHEVSDYCCCRFNMKNFTLVNRQLGRDSGTVVMTRYIKGLQNILGDNGKACRIGGDNFLVYFKREIFDSVKEYLMGSKVVTDNKETPEINISVHAGYYFVDEQCKNPEEIMDKLIIAMSMAKSNPSISFMVYDEDIRQKQLQKKWVESVFQSAIDNEEFLVYYQPKVDLKTYTIDGAEALCRWRHDGQLIPPYRFIPYLEMSNSICVLDFYMLEHACRDIRRWLDEGRDVVRISVNLSRVHLGNEGLVDKIIGIIDKHNVPHKYIEIELTETTTDVDFNELKKLVISLCDAGIHTSIDDFGTGFSSLSIIYDLPWNIIKIDRSFLPSSDNNGNKQKQIILKHIITMAQNLGIECIVEGVETIEHISLLKNNNCFRAQGFYFDKPLPVEQFESKLGMVE